MRRGETSPAVQKGLGSTGSVRKSMEKFVPWSRTAASEKAGNVSASPSTSAGQAKNNGRPMSTSSRSLKSTRMSSPGELLTRAEVGDETIGTVGRRTRQSTELSQTAGIDGRTSSEMSEGRSIVNAREKVVSSGTARRDFSKGKESSTKSMTSMRSMHDEIFTRNRERRYSVLQHVRSRDGQLNDETGRIECSTLTKAGRLFSTSTIGPHDEQDHHQSVQRSPALEDEAEASDEYDEEYGDEAVHPSQSRAELQTHALGFYNDDNNDHDMVDNEDVGDAVEVQEEAVDHDADSERDVQDLIFPTKAERKKERRQERAWLEKEGERRRKEGLPRNFLLVDEQTKKPYSGGVGDWKKELMLLSRDLDPAIGNINKQPEGAITEIVEWIQQTWEYSSPVKFEFIKEVIARGVTLRRAELWNKIRNGEDKPNGVSDRTWRTLERQLDNPASIRKSENCRRANASRVNFGRTGPSGEIGVRQRLRRILRCSPDPEEVRYEMARDKGFGGRHQKNKSTSNVMHGSGRRRLESKDMGKSIKSTGNFEEETGTENENEEQVANAIDQQNQEERAAVVASGEEVLRGRVACMSNEEISHHPFVLRMMQRLEALEGRQTDALVEKQSDSILEGPTTREELQVTGVPIPPELQDTGLPVQMEEHEVTPMSRRNLRTSKRGKSVHRRNMHSKSTEEQGL